MGGSHDKEELNEYASSFIKRKAREVAREYGFTFSDIEDLEQEFWLDLILRLPLYDVDRGSLNTFIARIVTNKIVNIKETRQATKRDYRLCANSLDEDVEDEEGKEASRATLFDEADCFRRLGWSCGPSEEQRDLKIDLGAVIDSLPSDLRELWERLRVQTITEISIAVRMSRSGLYRKIERICRILKARGLDDYL
jgi:RNA polymerase sigma factor (sigma-70 family)